MATGDKAAGAWSWLFTSKPMLKLRIRGSIQALPHKLPWRGTLLRTETTLQLPCFKSGHGRFPQRKKLNSVAWVRERTIPTQEFAIYCSLIDTSEQESWFVKKQAGLCSLIVLTCNGNLVGSAIGSKYLQPIYATFNNIYVISKERGIRKKKVVCVPQEM
jgi:hypothetical protein